MKNFKTLFLYTLLILVYSSSLSWAQIAEAVSPPDGRMTIYESPTRIRQSAAVSIRFQSDAMGYLDWKDLDGITSDYRVRYRPNDSTTEWTEVTTGESEVIVDKLSLDAEYVWEVHAMMGDEMIISGRGLLSTFAQHEPIVLSNALYMPLAGWFAQAENQRPFCDFLDRLGVHPMEKLAFLQAYSFDNLPLRKQSDFNNLSNWYPMSFQEMDCTGFAKLKERGDEIATECRCNVITRGTTFAAPAEDLTGGVVEPTEENYQVLVDNDRTYVVKLEAGAAKYIALRQDESGGSTDYSLSNMQGSDAAENASTNFAELAYTLGCIRTGGFSTNLPEKCQCTKPVDVRYEYTTSLHIKARKKGCIWSKGAAGQAEDFAFLITYNTSNGSLTALDAGHAMIGRECNSSWNPDFWLTSLGLIRPAIEYFSDYHEAQSQNPDSTVVVLPSDEQIDDFLEVLLEVLRTPFRNNSGDCADEPLVEEQVLITGIAPLVIHPNEPLFVALLSNHYLRTKGYGCYEAEASIASDYLLTGVVQGSSSVSRECCSDKFGNYIYGSLSAPSYSSIQNNAVNSLNLRRIQAGTFLAAYGDWYDQPLLSTGAIDLQGEFGFLHGPDCEWPGGPIHGFQTQPENNIPDGRFQVYPTSASDLVNVRIPAPALSGANLRVVNAQGQQVHQQFLLTEGLEALHSTLDVSGWPAGTYWVEVVSGSELTTRPFIKI